MNPILAIFFLLTIIFQTANATQTVVTLMTHDSFSVSASVLKGFEKSHNVRVNILKSGDAGTALTQAILSKNNPLADVFFGVDNTFMSRALKSDIFQVYISRYLNKIPEQYQLDKSFRLTPIDFGDVCLNFDNAWFVKHKQSFPKNLTDLTKPAYKSRFVVENPATSSPGLAFLLTTIGYFGESHYLNFWKQLRQNDVYISNSWTDAYYGQFSRAKGGTRPIVVSYASSPPAEMYFSEIPLKEPPTATLLAEGTTFRQVEFAGILKGTKNLALAQKLVDFLLSPDFQKDIPLQMWVFPVVPETPLPDIFEKFALQSENPVMLPPEMISNNRKKWIEAWTTEVLR